MRALPPSAGVIGWPVAHSKSPLIHRFWLAKLGLDGDYGRFPVHPDKLGAAIRALPALGLRGVNVTVPHKIAVIAHLDTVTPEASEVGAVNTVVVGEDGRLGGHNTDVDGVWEPTRRHDLRGARVAVIGAGGAARAAVAALKRHRVASVRIVNRTPEHAQAILRNMAVEGSAELPGSPLAGAALVINASVLGMAGAPPLDADVAGLPDDAIVFDAVYSPLDTPLLLAARARGLRTIDGLEMLVAQAGAAFELFYGAPAPRRYDAELRALLTA